MVSEDVRFKWRHIEIDGAGDTTHAVMFALKNYPMSTAPWMLHPIDKANYRCTLIQSYRFLSNAAAGGAIDRKQNKMFLAGDKAKDQEAELSRAHNRLLNREFVIGNHILMVLAFSDSRRWRNRVSGAVWRDLAYCGLQAMPIRGILGAAFLSAFPGNDAWKPRPGYINSINFGAFAPLYGWPKGDEKGNVDGPEIALFRTLAGTPYRYHWARDTGGTLLATNTLVTGESGSGKTTLIGFLIALSASRFRIMALAHKGGWKPLFEHLGGAYAALGDRVPHISALKAFSPTPANMEFLLELLRTCIGGTMTEEEGRRLALGLNTIKHELPIEEQCLAELRPFFDNTPEGAGARLEKWIWPTGELGWVIDAPQHTIKITDLCCYDTTALMDNMRARGPALACVFHEINLALDGTPTLIPIDEGWRSLIEEQTRNFIATELRMIRSKGGTLVFMTQSARDISDSGIANLLIEMCPNAFHMANPRGRREHYVDGLGLTDGQFDAFHGLQSGQGLFLLLQDHGARSVLAQAPFPQEIEHYLSILSPSELELRSEELEEYLEAAE
jgi:type IV secretion system protein VirB4